MNNSKPVVSAVIPTRNRPELVVRAVRSALAQTFTDLEVVVVIDGPDSETAKALSDIGDSRLRWIVLSESGGANRARNAGVDAAMGKWIALLDDDDEWLPEKIERQMACVSESDQDIGVVSCRFIARSPMGDAIWPRRLPDPGETVGDYLFVRHSFFNGGAVLLTSTLLMPKELLYRTRFSETVKKHQEAECYSGRMWLL